MKYFIFDIKNLTDEDILEVKNKMPERYKKSLNFLGENDQKRCLAAGILMLNNLRSFKESEIVYSPQGKPSIPGNFNFNISHSGDYVLLAIDDKEIGCDIQKIEEKNLKYSSKIFNQKEMLIFNKYPLVNFHVLWTQKEATLKNLGSGLVADLSKLDISAFENNEVLKMGGKSLLCETKLMGDYIFSIVFEGSFISKN